MVVEQKEGGEEEEELQAGAEGNTPGEKHHQSELSFMETKPPKTKRKGKLTGLCVVFAIS